MIAKEENTDDVKNIINVSNWKFVYNVSSLGYLKKL